MTKTGCAPSAAPYHAEGRQEYTMTLFGRHYCMVMNHIELNDDEEKGLLIVLRDLTAAYTAEKMRREFSAKRFA